VFSAIYGGIRRVKRHYSGAVGKVLGKELGNNFCPLNNPPHPASPPRRSALPNANCFLIDKDTEPGLSDRVEELTDLRLVHKVRSRVTIR
jgi:hypothetical protein